MERRYMDRPPPPPHHIYLTFQLTFLQSPIHSIYTNSESDKDAIYCATDKRFGLDDVAQTRLPVIKKLFGEEERHRTRWSSQSRDLAAWPKHGH
jgi:hypothetical protein